MAELSHKKALYIIANIGFADEIAEILREEGVGGATIMNARGAGAVHKSIWGITIDTEKEIILSVIDEDMSDKVIQSLRRQTGPGTPANSICFTMPVGKFVMTSSPMPLNGKTE